MDVVEKGLRGELTSSTVYKSIEFGLMLNIYVEHTYSN